MYIMDNEILCAYKIPLYCQNLPYFLKFMMRVMVRLYAYPRLEALSQTENKFSLLWACNIANQQLWLYSFADKFCPFLKTAKLIAG